MPNILLTPMTGELFHQYFRDFQNDPCMYQNPAACSPFQYDPAWVDAYILRQREKQRQNFAVMYQGKPVGEVVLKDIDKEACKCTLGIHLQNDCVKGLGIGTQAEQLILEYAIHTLGMKTIYTDSLLSNTRSRHVLEKVGFRYVRQDNTFAYYRYIAANDPNPRKS